MGAAQILEGLSYMVHSANSPEFFATGQFILVIEISAIINQQLNEMLPGHTVSFYFWKVLFDAFTLISYHFWIASSMQDWAKEIADVHV